MTPPDCPFCKNPILPEPFLRGATGYNTSTDSGVAPCPSCGKTIEFRVRSNLLELGYTYSSGSLHFEGMLSVRVNRLKKRRTETAVELALGDDILFSGPLP